MTRGKQAWIAAGALALVGGAALVAAGPIMAGTARHTSPDPERAGLQLRGERAEWRSRGLGRYGSGRVSGTVIYGPHQRQQVDLYRPDDALGDAPLIIYIHGGGWSAGNHKMVDAKPAHFVGQGYVFASAGYRVLPDASVEEQAADLGEALRAVRTQAVDYGFDPDRIVLIGHSAGAHLAALLASDPKYAGDAFGAIRGAVLVDGGGYDIALALTMPEMEAPLLYRDVFGQDAARHKALSPLYHVGGRDASHWLLLHLATRPATTRQAGLMADALRKAGRTAEVFALEGSTHMRINREIGTPAGEQQTAVIDDFLAKALGG